MKITDLNLICLEECFEYLEIGDILSVADVNKRLRKAAQCVYFRKYSEMPVDLCVINKYPSIEVYPFSRVLIVQDSKISLQLLRCFGQMITHVSYTNLSAEFSKLVFIYLNEYCVESLIDLSFRNVVEDQLELLTKTFTKVQKFVCCTSYLVKNGWLKRTFPNIQYFESTYYTRDEIATHNISCVMDHFPHLEQFKFHFYVKRLLDATKEHMKTVLHLNPQLKRLYLGGRTETDNQPFFDFDTFRNLIESMQNLEELTLIGSFASFSNSTGNKIHLKSVKRFEHFGNKSKYPFVFDQLEFLRIGGQVMDDVYDFIEQHPTIKELSFASTTKDSETDDYLSFSSNINISRLINVIPQLTKIEIIYHFSKLISANDLVRLVSGFKLLEKFSLDGVYKPTKEWRQEIRERLQDEWKIPAKYKSWLHMERYDHLVCK